MNSGYFGILPLNIRNSKNLKPLSKLLYCEITANLEDDGTCIKRNIFFSKVMDITKVYVSRCLKELRENGFAHVQIEFEKGTNKFIKRYITPIPTGNGVNPITSHTYIPTGYGVGDGSTGEDVSSSSTTGKTLLHNNSISKLYIDKQAVITIINPSINNKQLIALKNVASNFLHKQKKRFPHLFEGKDETDLLNKAINTLYDLIKLDNVNYNVVCDVLDYTLGDKFWHSQVTSLHTLRHKANNGNIKFHNILTSYNQQGG